MVSPEKKLADVLRGMAERACDSCIRKRARWYCATDDAFLCHFCDSLVHSENPLGRVHDRVTLKMLSENMSSPEIPAPPWHQGFNKKSRTPRSTHSNRHGCHRRFKSEESLLTFNNPLHTVPEIGSDEAMSSDEQLPYQVPVFDPFSTEISGSGEFKYVKTVHDIESDVQFHLMNGLNGFLIPSSESEVAEFSNDVHRLLEQNIDEDMEALGMVDCRFNDSERLKVKDEEQCEAAESHEIEMIKEPFQWSFHDYDSQTPWEVEDEKVVKIEDSQNQLGLTKNEDGNFEVVGDDHSNLNHGTFTKTKKMLNLDYEKIIAAWDDDRSPWMTGDRPELDPNDCWPNRMGGCGKLDHHHCGDMGNLTWFDGGREARVLRYREKRRRRMFSKKIRYEVRKVNAEKRPRIKGRFVKRTSFASIVPVLK